MSDIQFNKDNLLKNPLIKPYNKTKLNSIVVQFCYNDVIKDKFALLPVYKTLMLLTGQKPKIIRAKDSIAAFRVRKNMEIGALVTIRKILKINLLKLILLNLPKVNISNYSVSLKSFDDPPSTK
jgi:large subunit ribosomal protein L5